MPKIFGWQHLTYLAVVFVLMIAGWILIKKFVKKEKTLRIIFFCLGVVQLGLIIWNRAVVEPTWNIIKLLPTTFCGTTSLVIAFILMFGKKNTKPLQFITMCAFLGGILTLFYPDFIGQASSIFYSKTISGLLHHTLFFFTSVLILITGYLKPDFKKWGSLPLGLCIYMTYGIFQISIVGRDNAMEIMKPLISGTPLNWVLVGALFLVLYTIFLFIYEHFAYKKEDRFTTRFVEYCKSKKFLDRFYFCKFERKYKTNIETNETSNLQNNDKGPTEKTEK